MPRDALPHLADRQRSGLATAWGCCPSPDPFECVNLTEHAEDEVVPCNCPCSCHDDWREEPAP